MILQTYMDVACIDNTMMISHTYMDVACIDNNMLISHTYMDVACIVNHMLISHTYIDVVRVDITLYRCPLNNSATFVKLQKCFLY